MTKFVEYDYSLENRNPFDCKMFYSRDDPDEAISIPRDQVSVIMNVKHSSILLYITYRYRDHFQLNFMRLNCVCILPVNNTNMSMSKTRKNSISKQLQTLPCVINDFDDAGYSQMCVKKWA